MPLTAYCQSRP